jgi:hypothetical protein
VQLAKNAGYDSVFIELEHSTLSIDDASNLSGAALSIGITPFVRVPYQCGNGFVQKVMDAGAMGVIFPHVSSRSKFIIYMFLLQPCSTDFDLKRRPKPPSISPSTHQWVQGL